VRATDPVSFIRGLGVVLAAIVLATRVSAWRAARTNPLTAQRRE
jgi:protein-S-isoprenylcysteine O-methyltransferase Ste14